MSLIAKGSDMCLYCQTYKAIFCICHVHPSSTEGHVKAPFRNHRMPHSVIGETIAIGSHCLLVEGKSYLNMQVGNTISLTRETIESVFNIPAYDGCFGYRFASITHVIQCDSITDAVRIAGHNNLPLGEGFADTIDAYTNKFDPDDKSTDLTIVIIWFA